ncbi:hypothetical protein WA158_005549 [Blastocystis sp. Blastoise]
MDIFVCDDDISENSNTQTSTLENSENNSVLCNELSNPSVLASNLPNINIKFSDTIFNPDESFQIPSEFSFIPDINNNSNTNSNVSPTTEFTMYSQKTNYYNYIKNVKPYFTYSIIRKHVDNLLLCKDQLEKMEQQILECIDSSEPNTQEKT